LWPLEKRSQDLAKIVKLQKLRRWLCLWQMSMRPASQSLRVDSIDFGGAFAHVANTTVSIGELAKAKRGLCLSMRRSQ